MFMDSNGAVNAVP